MVEFIFKDVHKDTTNKLNEVKFDYYTHSQLQYMHSMEQLVPCCHHTHSWRVRLGHQVVDGWFVDWLCSDYDIASTQTLTNKLTNHSKPILISIDALHLILISCIYQTLKLGDPEVI